jgi:hypothetical protein
LCEKELEVDTEESVVDTEESVVDTEADTVKVVMITFDISNQLTNSGNSGKVFSLVKGLKFFVLNLCVKESEVDTEVDMEEVMEVDTERVRIRIAHEKSTNFLDI